MATREAIIRPAAPGDSDALVRTLRAQDAEELIAGGFASPAEGVAQSLAMSDYAWAVELDGELGAMLGVRAVESSALGPPRAGQFWFLTTECFGRRPLPFFRVMRAHIARVLAVYPVLTNIIDARYRGALRLAQTLGAELREPRPFGPHGALFVPYVIRRSAWAA